MFTRIHTDHHLGNIGFSRPLNKLDQSADMHELVVFIEYGGDISDSTKVKSITHMANLVT